MLIFWKCLMFFFGNVQAAKLNKKAKRLAKSNVKKEINFLAKELEVDKDEFTVHDVFVTKRDLEGLFDDVTLNFPVGLIVEIPWSIQLKTIYEKFKSLVRKMQFFQKSRLHGFHAQMSILKLFLASEGL